MSVPGTARSILRLLENAHKADYESPAEQYAFSVVNATTLTDLEDQVTLFLYRVDIDPTRRHIELPPKEFGDFPRKVLALSLHFLLTVWGSEKDDGKSLEVLQRCMECLDENAILTGAQLQPEEDWEPGVAVQLALESMSTEDMMRIWDSLDVGYRLSVPYVARTIRTRSREVDEHGPVVVRSLVSGQGGSR